MLSLETIDPAMKQQLKEQRLRNLEAQWFEMHMNKLAYEAAGLTRYIEETNKKLGEIQAFYDAISAIDTAVTEV